MTRPLLDHHGQGACTFSIDLSRCDITGRPVQAAQPAFVHCVAVLKPPIVGHLFVRHGPHWPYAAGRGSSRPNLVTEPPAKDRPAWLPL